MGLAFGDAIVLFSAIQRIQSFIEVTPTECTEFVVNGEVASCIAFLLILETCAYSLIGALTTTPVFPVMLRTLVRICVHIFLLTNVQRGKHDGNHGASQLASNQTRVSLIQGASTVGRIKIDANSINEL